MKKYLTGGSKLIEEVEVIKETERFVIVLDYRGKERRTAKNGHFDQYHSSWEGAKHYLAEKEKEEIDSLKRQLSYHEDRLSKIEALVKPEEAK